MNEKCKGIKFNIIDRTKISPLEITIHILEHISRIHKDEFEFLSTNFIDKLYGSDKLRNYIISDHDVEALIKTWKDDEEKFKQINSKFLLY